MPVKEEIAALREKIVNRARYPQGFTSDFWDVYRDGEARHQRLQPGLPERAAWDSYLYVPERHLNVVIILQYLSDEIPECQMVQLRGRNDSICTFALRLCIYDLAAPARGITDRQALYERLLGILDPVPDGVVCPREPEVGDTQVGHIVDLPIPRQSPTPWRLWEDADASAMIAAVHAGATVMLPIARTYVANKRDLFHR